MKLKFVLITCALFFTLLFAAREHVLLLYLKWNLPHYLPGKVTVNEGYLTSHGLYYEDLVFSNDKISVRVPTVRVTCTLPKWNSVQITLDLQEPQIELLTEQFPLDEWEVAPLPFINITLLPVIHNGTINQPKKELSLRLNLDKQRKGELHFLSEKNKGHLRFQPLEEGVQLYLNKVPLPALSQLMQTIRFIDGPEFEIKSGQVDGFSTCQLQGDRWRLSDSQFTVVDLQASLNKGDYFCGGRELLVKVDPTQSVMVESLDGGWVSASNQPLMEEIKGSFTWLQPGWNFSLIGNNSLENKTMRVDGWFQENSWSVGIDFEQLQYSKGTLSLVGSGHTLDSLKVKGESIDLRYNSLNLLKKIYTNVTGKSVPISLKEGTYNGQFTLECVNGVFKSASLQNCECNKGEVWINDSATIAFEDFQLEGEFSEAHSLLQSIQRLDWRLSEGTIHLPNYTDQALTFSNVDSVGKIKEGELLSGDLKGLVNEGTFSCTWGGDTVNRATFEGKGKDLALFLPDLLKKGFVASQSEENVLFQVEGTTLSDGLELKGHLKIAQEQGVCFGFELIPSYKLKWLQKKQMQGKKEHSLFGYSFVNGWFSTTYFPLDVWLSPLLMENVKLGVEGSGKVLGYFDDQALFVNFTGNALDLECPEYHVSIPSLPTIGQTEPTPSLYIPFNCSSSITLIPVTDGRFFSKIQKVAFEEISTLLHFNENTLIAHNMITHSCQLDMEGRVTLDYSNREAVNLYIEAQKISGSLDSTQNFLNHFQPPIFGHIPLKGNIHTLTQHSYWNVIFRPGSFTQEGYIDGTLSEGSLDLTRFDTSINDLLINFCYDTENHSLKTAEGQGCFSIGTEDLYTVRIPTLTIEQDIEPLIHFDLIVESALQDIMRLKGLARPSGESIGEMDITFDNESTFIGQMQPNIKTCRLSHWEHLLHIELDPTIKLETFFYDFSRFSKMFFGKNIRKWLQGYEREEAHGTLLGHLLFNRASDTLQFSLKGEELFLLNNTIHTLEMEGSYVEKQWNLHKCQIDQWNLQALWSTHEEFWNVDTITLKDGTTSSFFLTGKLFPADRHFIVDKGEVYVDLESLPSSLGLKGEIQAEGSGNIIFPNQDYTDWVYDSQLQVSYDTLKIKEIEFKGAQKLECLLNSDTGLQIKNVLTHILSIEDHKVGATFNIEEFNYDFSQAEWQVLGMHFSIPSEKLVSLFTRLFKETEISVDPLILEAIKEAKKEGELNGSLTINSDLEGLKVNLSLEDGEYVIAGIPHTLKAIQLIWNPAGLQLKALYCLQQQAIPFYLRTFSYDCQGGELILEEDPLHKLVLKWEWIEKNKMILRHISGELAGLSVRLFRDEELSQKEVTRLKGYVGIDVSKMLPFLKEEQRDRFGKLGLGEGFTLSGMWTLPHETPHEWAFEGKLEGKECKICNYYMSSCGATLSMDATHVKLTHFEVSDLGGFLSIPLLEISRKSATHWQLEVPKLHIEHLRPSLLRKEKEMVTKPGALVVQSIDLEGIEGNLCEETTLVGKGSLQFENRTRSEYHSLFTFPIDLLSRLGLDLGLFVPVSGRMDFKLSGGKVVLTDFMDVYSHEKGSQFYLEDSKEPSFIDFDGVLNVQVKMKQYNILLKLAELFTIYVRGEINKPLYTVQKKGCKSTKT